MMTEAERIKTIEISVQQLAQANQQLVQQLQETRTLMEKLAAVSGLEYSVDARDWANKEKLDALRKAPR